MLTARHVLLALVVLGGVTLAGCSFTSQDTTYPDEPQVRDQLASIETLEAEVVTETTVDGNETTVRTHLVREFDTGHYRSSVIDGPAEGMTVVMNESAMQFYDPSSNTLQYIDRPAINATAINRTVDTVSTIYNRLDDGDTNTDGQIGISPAPTVPSTGTGSNAGQPSMILPVGDNVTVTNAGMDTVDGREVRVVDLDSTDEKSLIQNATYYIDTEWHLPLQSTVAVEVGNQTTVTTSTYTNVTINGAIDAGTFEFQAPPTTTVVDGPNGSFQQFDERASLVEATDETVPDPSVPTGYEFESAEVYPAASGQSLTIVYAGTSDSITVTKRTESDVNLTNGEQIEIAGEPARRVSVGPNDAIVWTCAGTTYSVVGPTDGPSIADVAASMGCN
ncbi:LolA family protein [Salinarchaeum laminariae]|uniref:LolA family protein n=1 Tax=Salinarchaeum laminariae TaxID=869888 RepID=UPI0020BFD766|nr:hypothetical protein [Salinarchaeum laminariae]